MSLHYLEKCASTNDEISKFSESNFQAVYTFNQTGGRGQYGSSWTAEAGKNLAISFSIPVGAISLSPTFFNFYTANLLRDFTAKVTQEPVEIKWPNDLILKNKKIGGILLEKASFQKIPFYIIGFGLNINQQNFTYPHAGSLYSQTGAEFSAETIARELYSFFETKIFTSTSEAAILEDFNNHLFRRKEISVFQIKNVRQNGIIQKADEDGHLWIELENDGLQKFYHKEIELLY